MKKVRVFRVKVETTNALADTFVVTCEINNKRREYLECKNSVCYVATDMPGEIWDKMDGIVLSVEEVGPCYLFEEEMREI